MGIINPALDARIHWGWFLVSQVIYGVVAGIVVARQGTHSHQPAACRSSRGMGIEAPGLMESHPTPGRRDR